MDRLTFGGKVQVEIEFLDDLMAIIRWIELRNAAVVVSMPERLRRRLRYR